MSLGEIIGPPFFMWVYYTSVSQVDMKGFNYGMPFFIAGVIAIVALILLRWTLKEFKA